MIVPKFLPTNQRIVLDDTLLHQNFYSFLDRFNAALQLIFHVGYAHQGLKEFISTECSLRTVLDALYVCIHSNKNSIDIRQFGSTFVRDVRLNTKICKATPQQLREISSLGCSLDIADLEQLNVLFDHLLHSKNFSLFPQHAWNFPEFEIMLKNSLMRKVRVFLPILEHWKMLLKNTLL